MGTVSLRAESSSKRRLSRLLVRVDILVADDIVFSKITSGLNLDKHHLNLARIVQSMHRPRWDIEQTAAGSRPRGHSSGSSSTSESPRRPVEKIPPSYPLNHGEDYRPSWPPVPRGL